MTIEVNMKLLAEKVSLLRPSHTFVFFIALSFLSQVSFRLSFSLHWIFSLLQLSYGVTFPLHKNVKHKPRGSYELFIIALIFSAIGYSLNLLLIRSDSEIYLMMSMPLQLVSVGSMLYSAYYSQHVYKQLFPTKTSVWDFLFIPWGTWAVQPLIRGRVMDVHDEVVSPRRRKLYILMFLVISLIFLGSIKSTIPMTYDF
jgi:hypothetical protein